MSRNLATVVVRGVLPGLRRRRTELLPSGQKSSFQMRASFVFHLETKVLESGGWVKKLISQVNNNINLLNLYSAFLGAQSDLHRMRESPQPPPMCSIHLDDCDGSHIAPERPPHTSLLVERRQSNEANRCTGLLGGHDGQRPMGKFGQNAGFTPLSTLFQRISWDF